MLAQSSLTSLLTILLIAASPVLVTAQTANPKPDAKAAAKKPAAKPAPKKPYEAAIKAARRDISVTWVDGKPEVRQSSRRNGRKANSG